jgi:hypothetical protein
MAARPKCSWCGERFRTQNAAFGHLRSCKAYRAQAEHAQPAEPAYGGSKGADQVLREQLQAEETRLKLRQLQTAHRELDFQETERARREQEAAEAARQAEFDRGLTRERARHEADERRRQEQAEAARQQRRRAVIQRVKAQVGSGLYELGLALRLPYRVPDHLKGRALRAVEEELTGLRVDELPEAELVAIAEGVRDRVYGEWMATENEARERQAAEHRAQEAKEAAEDEARRAREREARAQREKAQARKEQLYKYGQRYANEAVADEGINGLRGLLLVERIDRDLWAKLDGSETERAVERMVDAMVDEAVK